MYPMRRRRHISPGMIALILLILMAIAGLCEVLHMVIPQATGDVAWKEGGATLDASHAENGYVMISKASGKKLKVRIMYQDVTYTYDLPGDGEYEVYPLQKGSGKYKIVVYENVKGNSYAQVLTKSIDVKMKDNYSAYLCPNRYVNYSPESTVVALGAQITEGISGSKKKAEAIMNWMVKNLRYDYIAAMTVQSGFVPDLESMLEKKSGFCFDFSSAMCAMLRTQGIPAQLVMGDADGVYHAWCNVLIDGKWVRYDPTMDITKGKVKKYIEEACY